MRRTTPLRLAVFGLAALGLAACGGVSDPGGQQTTDFDLTLLSAGFYNCVTECDVATLETVELAPWILAAAYECTNTEGGESFDVDFAVDGLLIERRTYPCLREGTILTSGIVRTTDAWSPSDSGAYDLRIVADPAGQLAEADENNNEATLTFSVKYPEPSLVSAGPSTTCATWTSGRAYCWGLNGQGQLGIGSTVTTRRPWAVAGRPSYFAVGETYGAHRCAVGTFVQDLPSECWGANGSGQLGNGTTTASLSPVVVSTQAVFTTVVAGASHTCGLTAAREVYCWGDNALGQLGTGGTTGSTTPVVVPAAGYTALVAGARHTCALDASGAAWCWGSNQFGQLGTGATGGTETSPAAVTGGLAFTRLAGGAFHTCGVTTAGDTVCWGLNGDGQLGAASAEACTDDQAAAVDCHSSPLTVAGSHAFAVVYAGGAHSCGILETGAAWCWGNGADGQLGNGATTSSQDPVAVSGDLAFNHVSLGLAHTCGLAGVRFYCWGNNDSGQLGGGGTAPSAVPVRVDDPFWGAID